MNSITNYDLSSFIPQEWRGWDDYRNRLQRYEVFEGYYHNIAYHSIVTYSQGLKTTERLYKHVRGVYNPVNRLVESYVAKLYGGMLDTQEGEKGVIPLESENEQLIPAILQLWRNSLWQQKKSLYARYGAKCGDTFIKIADDIHKGQVRMEVVDPSKIKSITKQADGTIIKVEFEYYIRRQDKLVKYREIITPDKFIAMDEDGKALHSNGRNEAVTEWDNEYGFVPLVHTMHTDVGLDFGAPVTHGLLHKINELNDLASILNDGMRKQVNMPLFSKGVEVQVRTDLGSDGSSNSYNKDDNPKKDTLGVINLPGENADIIAVAPVISIADGLLNITSVLDEIERDAPELSLHRIREGGNATAPGTRAVYDDAISKYQESRGIYNAGLIEAQKMGVAIGGMRGYEGFEGFGLMSMDNGAVNHQIQARPVINDSLSMFERQDMTLRGMQQVAPQIFYVKMGWSDEEADDFIKSSVTQQNSFLQTETLNNAISTPTVDDPDASPSDAFDSAQNSGLNSADILNADALLAAV